MQHLFFICCADYRNHRYCQPSCRQQTQSKNQKQATKRYRKTLQGRRNNAARQKRFRERKAANKNKVTHETSIAKVPNVKTNPIVLLKNKIPANDADCRCIVCGEKITRISLEFPPKRE